MPARPSDAGAVVGLVGALLLGCGSESGALPLEVEPAAEPLELHFVEAASHYLPDLSEDAVSDAVAADFDGDGDSDLLVAVRDGQARLLRNRGAGSFQDDEADAGDSAPALTTWVQDTAALVTGDFDDDGDLDVFLCNRAGQPSRLALGDGTGAFELDDAAFPGQPLGCRAAASADVNGDGQADLVVVGKGPIAQGSAFLQVFLRQPTPAPTFVAAPGLTAPAAVDGMDCGQVEALPELPASYTLMATPAAAGAGAGRATFDLTAGPGAVAFSHAVPKLNVVPDAVELQLGGDSAGATVELRLVDGEGETFLHDLGPVTAATFEPVTVGDLASWSPSGGNADGLIDLPIASLALVVSSATGGMTGELLVDELRLVVPRIGTVVVEDFDRYDFALSWAKAADGIALGDLDGDGDTDVVLSSQAGAATPLRVLLNHADGGSATSLALHEASPDGLAVVADPVAHPVLLDLDQDGDLDLFAVGSQGQDRLLINDGHAHFFDDTVSALPVDKVSGAHATAIDLDQDGAQDLVIANLEAANRIYLARDGRRFVDATPALPIEVDHTLRMVPLDVDADGDTDLFTLNQQGEPSRLYIFSEQPDAP